MIRTFSITCLGLAFCYATGVWLDKTCNRPAQKRTRIAQNQINLADPAQSTPEYRVTAYCPKKCCCGRFADGITASGHVIKKGDKFVAADLPFGTLLAIEGYAGGLAVPVLDRGGAIKRNRIDCYFDSHQEALNFGVRYLKARILK